MSSFVGVWLIRGEVQVAASLRAQAQAVRGAIASHAFGVLTLLELAGLCGHGGKPGAKAGSRGLR